MKQLAPYQGQQLYCANCGAPMQGEFCHACGQSIHSVLQPMHAMVEETIETVLHIDGRIVRTLPPLLLNPGFLTLEYFGGRRVRYIAPFRLMFVLCLLALFVCHLAIDRAGNQLAPLVVQTTANPADVPDAGAGTAHSKLDDELSRQVTVDVAWLPAFVNAQLARRAERIRGNLLALKFSSSRAQAVERIKNNMFHVLPQTMFVLIPVFALLLKLFYVFRRRLYMEHLIVALHSHAYLFLSLLLGVSIDALAVWLTPYAAWGAVPLRWLVWGLALWVPVYLLIMQKRIYRQGWPMTVLKFWLTGWCYLWLLSSALLMAALLGMAS